jgi:hypothetical protein
MVNLEGDVTVTAKDPKSLSSHQLEKHCGDWQVHDSWELNEQFFEVPLS